MILHARCGQCEVGDVGSYASKHHSMWEVSILLLATMAVMSRISLSKSLLISALPRLQVYGGDPARDTLAGSATGAPRPPSPRTIISRYSTGPELIKHHTHFVTAARGQAREVINASTIWTKSLVCVQAPIYRCREVVRMVVELCGGPEWQVWVPWFAFGGCLGGAV